MVSDGHRPCAAGATWTRITTAPWAARFAHTTVIDAAGSMYLMGGLSNSAAFNDVWQSAGAGANTTHWQGVLKDTQRASGFNGTHIAQSCGPSLSVRLRSDAHDTLACELADTLACDLADTLACELADTPADCIVR